MADIVLKNALGQAVSYFGVEGIGLYDAQGAQQVFVPQGSSAVDKLRALIDGSVTAIGTGDLAGVTKLRWHAFESCVSLEQAVIVEGIKSIPGYCFSGCVGLKTADIPSTITSIGDHAFAYTDLRTLTCRAATPPTMHADALYGYGSGLTAIYVPSASVASYKAASGWSDYASIIQAIPT